MIALAAVIAELCAAPPAPAASPDLADSRAYQQAGDDARAAGDVRIAAIAYRKAIELDPGNTGAAEALAALCRADAATPAAAAPPADDATALLAAIARFRAGELDEARRRLAPIALRGGAAAAGAHMFLGLIALRDHDGGTAVDELELARRDPEYAGSAEAMLRLAHRDGALALTLLAAPEVDTNPQLLPDTPPVGAASGPPMTDEDLLLVATGTARPWRWLALRDVVAWRNQLAISSLDFIGETAQAEVDLDHGAEHVAIRYDLDVDVLGGSAYLVANRGTVSARHDLGEARVFASYALRRRAFEQAAQAGFTGWVHSGELGVTLHATQRLDIDVRGVAWRELTTERTFSDVAGGGGLAVRARPDPRVRITAAALLWYAGYDVPEPDGVLRRDGHGEGTLDLEVDVSDHVIALAGAGVAYNDSTVEDFRYWKVVARAGLSLAFGGP